MEFDIIRVKIISFSIAYLQLLNFYKLSTLHKINYRMKHRKKIF